MNRVPKTITFSRLNQGKMPPLGAVPEYVDMGFDRPIPRWIHDALDQISLTREEFFEARDRGEYTDIPVPEGWR